METSVEVAPALVVQKGGLDLTQGAEHEQDVEYLMALHQEITSSRKQSLRQRMRKEKGTQEKEGHLTTVKGHGAVSTRIPASKQPTEHPLEDRARVPAVGDRRRHHLADLAHPGG